MAASSLEQKLSRLEAKLKQENREARRRIDLNLDISPQRPRPSKYGGVGEGAAGAGLAPREAPPLQLGPAPASGAPRSSPAPPAVGSRGEGHGDPGGVGPGLLTAGAREPRYRRGGGPTTR